MTFAMRCLAVVLMLSPALSLALVWSHTEGLRRRLVEQEEAQARLKEDIRILRSTPSEPGDGNVEDLRRRVDEMVAIFGSWQLPRKPDAPDGDQTTARVDPMRPNVAVPPSWKFPPRKALVVDPEHALVMTDAHAVIAQAERLRRAYTAAGLPLSWQSALARRRTMANPEHALAMAHAAIAEADGLRDANRTLAGLNSIQRASAMWISALAIAGLLGFTVLQHYTARIAFVDAVRIERDRLKTRLKELTLELDGFMHASAERNALKHRVKYLARERDRLMTRLQGIETQRDDLKRRIKYLENEAAGLADTARERDQLKTRLQEAEAERDDLKRRVRRLENEATANRRADPGGYAAGLALLGLRPPFTHQTARTAYRKVSRTIHPDVCKGPEASRLMRLATECYERIAKA